MEITSSRAKTDKNAETQAVPTIVDGWIQDRFARRECVRIVATQKDRTRCCCGRTVSRHDYADDDGEIEVAGRQQWDADSCTAAFPTDAYGTLTFSVEKGSQKARYIRTDPEAGPSDLWRLLVDVWGLEPPALIITIHDDGEDQHAVSPSFLRAFKKGLAKAAGTASTWIITSGLKSGITRHVTNAFVDTPWRSKLKRIHIIGFAPWGLVRGSEQLLLKDGIAAEAAYFDQWCETGDNEMHWKTTYLLDEGHSAFILVDDGTMGQESTKALVARRRFENFLRSVTVGNTGSRCVPMVCLLVNGTLSSLDAMLEYVSSDPVVPVLVCADTGGAADWITTIDEILKAGGNEEELAIRRHQLLFRIQTSLGIGSAEAQRIASVVTEAVQSRQNYVTIYHAPEPESIFAPDSEIGDRRETCDLDLAMLNALLKGLPLTATEKLNLTVVWDREDLAREILEDAGGDEAEWPNGSLDVAMMNALMYDRVGFVNLLLASGIVMERFLTISRLEQLYNSESGPTNTLCFALPCVAQEPNVRCKYKLPEIGWVVEKFMGYGFRSTYCRKEFLRRYNNGIENSRRQSTALSADPRQRRGTVVSLDPRYRRRSTLGYVDDGPLSDRRPSIFVTSRSRPHFAHPYHELFIWAVLTNRKHLAMCFWQNGEDQLAKALVGSRLYQSLAEEAEQDYSEVDLHLQLEANANEFKTLASELLAECYDKNDALTLQLLTYEVRQFSKSTCISLAANCKNEAFVAHRSCQLLLADLWLGGLRVRKFINLKVIAGILFPPLIALLTFKTMEELHLQAQTVEESHKSRGKDDRRRSVQENLSDLDSDDSNVENETMDGEDNLAFIEEIQIQPMPDLRSYCGQHEMDDRETSFTVSPATKRTVKFSPSVDVEGVEGTSQDLYRQYDRSEPEDALDEFSDVRRQSQATDYSDDEELDMPPIPRQTRRFATASELVAEQLGVKFLFDKPPVENERVHREPLAINRKFLEFFSAPVTAFWSFTLGYVLFLSIFTYIVLVRTPPEPSWPEYYVIVFVITFSADQIRKILVQEPRRLKSKLKVFASSVWDSCTVLACGCFFLALFLRVDPETVAAGRVLYCVNIVFWYLRILKLLNVNNALSPYIHMYGKMVVQMVLMCAILLVIVVVFGIVRQAIIFPDEDWQWALLRNIVYKPYAMLYGALYEMEITECDDFGLNCKPGYWLTPIFMSVYLLLSVLMFLNIIVAALSNIFEEVTARAQEIAKFGAYRHVMEFEQQPFLPPPLVIFAHAYMIGKFVYKKFFVKAKNYRFAHSLKLLLSPEEKEKLHEFERNCLTELLARKAEEEANSVEARLESLSQRVEAMTTQIDHLHSQEQSQRLIVSKVEKAVLSVQHDSQTSLSRMQSVSYSALPSLMRSISDLPAPPRRLDATRSSLPTSMNTEATVSRSSTKTGVVRIRHPTAPGRESSSVSKECSRMVLSKSVTWT